MLVKGFRVIVDIIEVYIPVIIMASLFVVFMIGIFSRYLFTHIRWAHELSLVLYLWLTLFGSLYALREDTHVSFSVFYDTCSPRTQTIFRLIGSTIIVVGFVLAIKPTYDFVLFMRVRFTYILRIPYTVVLMPFMLFLIATSIRLAVGIVKDVKHMLRKDYHSQQ